MSCGFVISTSTSAHRDRLSVVEGRRDAVLPGELLRALLAPVRDHDLVGRSPARSDQARDERFGHLPATEECDPARIVICSWRTTYRISGGAQRASSAPDLDAVTQDLDELLDAHLTTFRPSMDRARGRDLPRPTRPGNARRPSRASTASISGSTSSRTSPLRTPNSTNSSVPYGSSLRMNRSIGSRTPMPAS